MAARMHADEADVDAALVRRLLAACFPDWAPRPLVPVASSGTDHALYRLGDDLLVRLPRLARVVDQVEREHRWLPRLAPQLPVAIPTPVARGSPAAGYPWPWSVYRWLAGENPVAGRIPDAGRLATELAAFVAALHAIDPAGGPPPGAGTFFRGAPLATRDERTRAALAALRGEIDTKSASAVWGEALRTPPHAGPPVWIHGDLAPGNLLCVDGRLAAVIDFGGSGVGDPACDLIVAWNLFDDAARRVYRSALAVDEATWSRGRGWALSVALLQLPYYRDSNPALAANARRTIREVLAERQRRGA